MIKLNNETKWNEKHWNLIQQNYSKTKFFNEISFFHFLFLASNILTELTLESQ